MESPEGDCEAQELTPGQAVYVPGRYAHRTINTSPAELLITFFAFPGHAGHDYGTIESQGFRKLVVQRDGVPASWTTRGGRSSLKLMQREDLPQITAFPEDPPDNPCNPCNLWQAPDIRMPNDEVV